MQSTASRQKKSIRYHEKMFLKCPYDMSCLTKVRYLVDLLVTLLLVSGNLNKWSIGNVHFQLTLFQVLQQTS